MALLTNNAEIGQADGTTVTTGNSGGGTGNTAFGAVSGSTVTVSSTQEAHGSFSYKFDVGVSVATYVQCVMSAANGAVSFRGYYYYDGTGPTSNEGIVRVRSASADGGYVQVTNTDRFRVTDATAATLWTAAAAFPSAGWYRYEAVWTKGTTTSNGRVQFTYAALDGAAIESYDSTAAVNTGTADYTNLRVGRTIANANTVITYLDDLAWQDGGTTFLGPVPANVKPVASGAARQSVNAGQAVTLSWSQSDPDGTIGSNAVSQTSGTTVTLSGSSGTGSTGSRTFTAPAAGAVLVFSITATDNLGLPSDPFIHTVYVRHATLKVYELVSNPGGSVVVGAADLVTALSDASDSSYSETVDNPAGAIEWYRLTPAASGAITMRARDKVNTGSPARSRTVQLVQGPTTSGTVIATIGPITPTTSATDYTHLCTSGEMAAVTDQDQLLYKVTTS